MTSNLWIFGTCSFLLAAAVVVSASKPRLPGNNQGYEPVQPIEFSHRLHAGDLKMDCQYCHYGARSSRHAGVPSASICMNCHTNVTAGFDALLEERARAETQHREPELVVSSELAKLYASLGLDETLAPIEGAEPNPIEWVRVHNIPDFVYFDHRPHVARGIACETCHGPVQSMERMRQESTLSMGWCIHCHRSNPADRQGAGPTGDRVRVSDHVSTDCVTCHL